jgi:hypothetical protein
VNGFYKTHIFTPHVQIADCPITKAELGKGDNWRYKDYTETDPCHWRFRVRVWHLDILFYEKFWLYKCDKDIDDFVLTLHLHKNMMYSVTRLDENGNDTCKLILKKPFGNITYISTNTPPIIAV